MYGVISETAYSSGAAEIRQLFSIYLRRIPHMFTAIENALTPWYTISTRIYPTMFSSFFSSPSGCGTRSARALCRCAASARGAPRVRQSHARGEKHASGMSSFQALATAIAAQVGTGNIVGASGAILTGGPGAIFWMWVIAFFRHGDHLRRGDARADHPAGR